MNKLQLTNKFPNKFTKEIDFTTFDFKDIIGCYNPSEHGFDIKKHLSLPEHERLFEYHTELIKFFSSKLFQTQITLEDALKKLSEDSRFTNKEYVLYFVDGSFKSLVNTQDIRLYYPQREIKRIIQDKDKLYFYHLFRGKELERYYETELDATI